MNVADLPAQYLAKYYTVYAKVLHSLGQYTEALDRAKDALSAAQVRNWKQEIKEKSVTLPFINEKMKFYPSLLVAAKQL